MLRTTAQFLRTLTLLTLCVATQVGACTTDEAGVVDSGSGAPVADAMGSADSTGLGVDDTTSPADSVEDDGSGPGVEDVETAPDIQTDMAEPPDTVPDLTEPVDGSAETDGATEPDAAPIPDVDEDSDASAALPSSFNLLFVGNSYVYTNDLPSVVRTVLLEAGIPASGLMVDSVTYGGYRLEQHAADAAGTGSQPRLRNTLVGGGVVEPAWDVVVLQEQSQIPGFGGGPEYAASLSAAVELHGLIDAIGAQTALFMTWGYRTGDARNSAIFPDYLTMQSRLESGYTAMSNAISAAGGDATVVAVGAAWRRAWQADVTEGRNPVEAGSLFSSLHSADLSHPAPAGTYLTACVFVNTLLGVDVTTLDDTTPGVTDAALADRLQELAMVR